MGGSPGTTSPADLLTNQAVLDPKVHCHTSRALLVGIEPVTPQSRAVALPTTPLSTFSPRSTTKFTENRDFSPDFVFSISFSNIQRS
jgi:hypothetical protein